MFVIEEAEALRDESQNALLKTLEEPAPFAHLILLCSEPELLAGTILSRCRDGRVRAAGAGRRARGARRVRRRGRGGRAAERRRPRARPVAADRARAARFAPAPSPPPGRPLAGDAGAAEPWRALLEAAEEAGAERRRRGGAAAARGGRGRRRAARPLGASSPARRTEQVKRTERRARTEALDLGLALCCAWYRDLAAVAPGADERRAQRRPPRRARRRRRGARPGAAGARRSSWCWTRAGACA